MPGVNNWRVGLPWPKEHLDLEDIGDVEYLYEDDDGATKNSFDQGRALAAMLLAEAIFLNSNWWFSSWPDEAKKTVALCVNTNDVFAWGCADAENITYDQIEEVYRYWAKDPQWGTAIWAIINAKELPQRPVADSIRKAGIWDLDALTAEHGLRANHYDGVSRVLALHKYEAFCAWAARTGREVLEFTSGWWAGWKEYTAANPGWYDDAWKAEDDRRADAFKVENGFSAPSSEAVSPQSEPQASAGNLPPDEPSNPDPKVQP
jgi:hypothetical protein